MACINCGNQSCGCSNVILPELEVKQPFGSDGVEVPCEECEPADNCCNIFEYMAEGEGASLFFNRGAPFVFPNPDASLCLDGQMSPICCPGLTPEQLFVLCPPTPIPPGTYMITVRATLSSPDLSEASPGPINGGAKLSVRWVPDCGALTTGQQQVTGILNPCCCTSVASQAAVGQVLEVAGSLMIYSPGCNPALVVYGINGCPDPAGINVPLTMTNFQVTMLRISSRDLITACGGQTSKIASEFSCQTA